MGVGLEVTNEAGGIQVIDTAPLLTYINKISLDSGDPSTTNLFNSKNVIACKPAQNNLFYASTANSGIYDYRAVGKGDVLEYGFNIAPEKSGNFGLEVYNSEGVLQYTSNQKALKIIDVVNIPDIRYALYAHNGRETIWHKEYPGIDVGVVFIQVPVYNQNPYIMSVGAAKRSATELTLETTPYLYDPNPIYSNFTFYALIVDVTGY